MLNELPRKTVQPFQTWRIIHSTTVIAKIKEIPRSLFNDIPRNVKMGYEKWYTPLHLAQCEKKRAFKNQNHVNYM